MLSYANCERIMLRDHSCEERRGALAVSKRFVGGVLGSYRVSVRVYTRWGGRF